MGLTMVTMAKGIMESVKLTPMPRLMLLLILMQMHTLLDRSMLDSMFTMLMLPAMLIMLDTLLVLTMDTDVSLVMVPLVTVAMPVMDTMDMLTMVTMATGIMESVKLTPLPMLMPTLLVRSMLDSMFKMHMLLVMLIMLDTL